MNAKLTKEQVQQLVREQFVQMGAMVKTGNGYELTELGWQIKDYVESDEGKELFRQLAAKDAAK